MQKLKFIKNIIVNKLKNKKFITLAIVLFFIIILPLLVWSVLNQRQDLRKKASDNIIPLPTYFSEYPTPTPNASSSPMPIDIDILNEPFIGPVDAPVTIIEFLDFQCSFSNSFYNQAYKTILSSYPDKVKIVFKDFPLSLYPNSFSAAEAAQCAFEQNKYLEMQNLIFANRTSLSAEKYVQLAQSINLNMDQFNTCMSTHKYEQEIIDDRAEGYTNGVTGTPSFFISGEIYQGALPFTIFQGIIDGLLGTSPTATPYLQKPGDINSDGRVNIVDVGIIADNYRTSPPGDPRADLNHDGEITIVDLGIVIDNYEL